MMPVIQGATLFAVRPPMPEGRNFMQLGAIFGGLGVLLFVVGVAISLPRFLLVANGAVAEGFVVELKKGSKGSKRAVVEFKPKGQPKTRVTATVGNSSATHSIGERVQVYYDPSDPSDALIDSFVELWFFALMFNGMGLMWIAIGGPFFFIGRGRKKARDRLRANGLHAAGTVVHVEQRARKNTIRYRPIVEAVDPISGAVAHFPADERYDGNVHGRPAMVHLEPHQPHRYYVDV
jgi:hypothetical protein